MNFIKYCDLFQTRFHFYTNNSINFSIFGGIMFTLYIIITVFVFLFFSYDNLNKLKPITTKSESPEIGYSTIKIGEEKIWIPWRITTYENQFIDHKGLLYPIIYLVHGKENEKNIIELEYERLNYKLCNETSMANYTNYYKLDIKLDNLFCIDNDDLYLGGSWNLGYIYFIEINLYLCEGGKNFNKNDAKCSSFKDLFNFKNKSLLFEFFYPEVRFQPLNYDNPMEVIYKNHFYEIKEYNIKYERIYIRNNILSDDRSLFINKPSNISLWGIDALYGDAYLSEIYDLNNKNPSSKIFSLSIYKGKGLIHFTRNYKKFFLIVSEVFPFLYIIYFIFRGITDFVKLCCIRKRLFELLFENSFIDSFNKKDNNSIQRKKYILRNYFNYNTKKTFKNDLFKNSLINNNIKKKSHQALTSFLIQNNIRDNNNINNNYNNNDKLNNLSISNLSNSNLGINFEFKVLNKSKNLKKTQIIKKPINNIAQKRRMSKTVIQKNKDFLSKKIYLKKNKKELFPFIYYFSDIFISKVSNPHKCIVPKKYLIVYKFINKVYDISSFLILYKQFNIFKNIYAKEELLDIINTNKKMNINNKEISDELCMNSLNNIFHTFSELLLREQNF